MVSPLSAYAYDIKIESDLISKQEYVQKEILPSYSIVHPTVSQSLLFVGAFFQLLPAVPLFSSQQYNAGVAKIFESIQYSSLSFSAVMLVDWLLSVFFYFLFEYY